MLPCSRAIDCDSDYPHQTIIWCDDMIWWYDKIYNIYSQNVYIVYIVYILLFSVIITVLSSKTAWFLWKPGIYISDFTISQPILFHILNRCYFIKNSRRYPGTDADARPGYAAYDASEYLDEPEVLQDGRWRFRNATGHPCAHCPESEKR